ncbi:MAG: 1-phosphofructokinase family hexose kinase [Balneolaceae bacterium]|nr:1-phosphofructokinase family hexose kinase [Balneolaceae bacterium]MCH8548433.1 1-phosphofructokinase family hexose kinase [Balneolaceae bacterium]
MILVLCPNPSIDKLLYVDRLNPGSVNKSSMEKMYPGGKGVHVALALTELGESVTLSGFWGGESGTWIKNECRKKGITCVGPLTKQWNRTCLTILSDQIPQETEIVERGPAVNELHLDHFFSELADLIPKSNSVVVSGSWPPGTPKHVYQQIKDISERHSVPLWVDASGERLTDAICAEPFGIHINHHEAEEYFGKALSPKHSAEKLLTNSRIAAVTNGADGLYMATRESIIHTSCRVDHIISTVGSGDCLTAGLVHAWNRSSDLHEMAKVATACGTANCICPDLGMLKSSDVHRLQHLVTTNAIYPL